LGTFAAECYQYLRTEDGKRLLEDASTALELRRTHERLGTSELRYSAEVKSNFFDKKVKSSIVCTVDAFATKVTRERERANRNVYIGKGSFEATTKTRHLFSPISDHKRDLFIKGKRA